MKNLIVVILSDQTIPNVLFIKEFCKQKEDEILFVSTSKMREKAEWIKNTLKLGNKIYTIEVDSFDGRDIEEKLYQSEIEYDNFEAKYINITGGTKIMSLEVYNFFKNQGGCDIYYVKGGSDYFKLFPIKKEKDFKFTERLSIEEYFKSYGFDSKYSNVYMDKEYTYQFFKWFVEDKNDNHHRIISLLQDSRKKINNKKSVAELERTINGLEKFLNEINYPNKEILAKKDVDYLTGNWFEEYIYHKLKDQNVLGENLLIGVSRKNENTENELDIVYLKNNELSIIECKTYIVNKSKDSLPNDTIYKLDSILRELGLFAKSYIATLNKNEDLKEPHRNRAKQYRIELITLEDLKEDKFITDILKIGNAH